MEEVESCEIKIEYSERFVKFTNKSKNHLAFVNQTPITPERKVVHFFALEPGKFKFIELLGHPFDVNSFTYSFSKIKK